MRFTKMHGAGNDYVYVDCVNGPVPGDLPTLARRISDRHFGVGSDGLILICPSDRADFRMRMFNADGSESEMCGNGIRCVAKYVYDHGLADKDKLAIETGRGVLELDLEIEGARVRRVRVDMGTPILEAKAIPTTFEGERVVNQTLDVDGRELVVTCVSMGNPHAVTYVDDVAGYPVTTVGPRVEHHPAFPNRVNAHFVQILSPTEVRMRAWERGTGETLACGTGACAVCVAGVLTGRTERQLTAHLPGGTLDLDWADDNHVYLTGPAEEVFTGDWPG